MAPTSESAAQASTYGIQWGPSETRGAFQHSAFTANPAPVPSTSERPAQRPVSGRRLRASGSGGADGGAFGEAGGEGAAGGCGFDGDVPAGGYRWHYFDGVSDCGEYAFTVIAFVGSVFSTWYHFAGRRDPDNHVALNVVLYTPQGDYWAMTERGRHSQARSSSRFRIGPSMVQHVDGGLVIDFDEIAPPFPPRRLRPRRLRGRIVLTPRLECGTTFALDPEGRHKWWPVAPAARVRVESNVLAGGGWEGSGYHDLNWGTRPLETDFRGWDWSRGQTPDGGAMVLYDARLRDGDRGVGAGRL